MKTGKISETVLKRSVRRLIKGYEDRRSEAEKGTEAGGDCAFFSCHSGFGGAAAIQPFCLGGPGAGVSHAIISALNNIAAGGAEPAGILLSVLLPPDSEEEDLKEVMKLAGETCARYSVRIIGGHTEVTDAVNRPLVTAAGIGTLPAVRRRNAHGAEECDAVESGVKKHKAAEVVASKWIGLEGTSLLAHRFEEVLLSRYPASLVAAAKAFDQYLPIMPEAALAAKYNVPAMHDARSGGIFGALWELGEALDAGLEIDLKKIPVRQETVEVCELLDVNPYTLLAGGMLLMAARSGEELVSKLREEGIPAAVIGRTTDRNDRIVRNGDEIRFLTPPNQDEIYRKY